MSGGRVKNVRGALRVEKVGPGARGSSGAQSGKNLLSEEFKLLGDEDIITRLGTAHDVLHINGVPVEQIVNKSGTLNPAFAQQVLADIERVREQLTGAITETQLYQNLNDRIDLIDDPQTGLVTKTDQLSTRVDDNEATLQVHGQSLDGLEAQYTIKLDVNGHVAGIGLASTTNDEGQVTSDIIMLADRFSIAFPAAPWSSGIVFSVDQFTKPTTANGFVYRCVVGGTTGSTEPTWPTTVGAQVTDGSVTWECTAIEETIPFIVAMVNGSPKVIMDEAMIASLEAGKITAGTITASGIYLGDTTFHLDAFNKQMVISDAQATPQKRVEIGKLGPNASDYGIRIYDENGNLVFDETGIQLVGGYGVSYPVSDVVDIAMSPRERGDSYIRWNQFDGLPGDGRFHAPIWGGPDGGTKLIDAGTRAIEPALLREAGGVALNRSLAKASAADPDGLNGVPNRLVDYLTDTASFARVTAAALTSNQPDLSKAGIINKTADQIAETAAKKWAGETGADVTGAHTSADTSNVAGRAAGTVRDESRNGHNLTVAGSGQTLGDPRNQAFVQIGNRNSVQSSTSLLTGVDDGGLGARIDVAAHTLYIGGVNLSMPSGSIIASYSTTYYVYADVDALNPGSTTYAASTSYARTYGNKHRYYVGKITTPSSGGGNTGGGGGGGTIPP